MYHCLSRNELKCLIESKISNETIEDDELRLWVDNACYWQDEIAAFNYFLSKILERKLKDGHDCMKLIDIFYMLEEEMAFNVQEFSRDFIDYMLRNIRDPNLSLEEDLIRLQDSLSEHSYHGTLRY